MQDPPRLRFRDALALAAVALAVALVLLAPVAGAFAIDAGLALDLPAARALDGQVSAQVALQGSTPASPSAAQDPPEVATHSPPEDPFAVDPAQDEPLARSVITLAAAPAGRATIGAALLLAAAAAKQLAVAGLAGYARISKSEVLDHATRERMLRAITETPGLSLSEVQARFALGWGTAVYHLDRLESAGHLASERSGFAKRYYPRAALSPGERAVRAVLARPQLAKLAERVLAEPGLSQQELAHRLGITAGAATKQLAALEGAGLVQRVREGKVARVAPTAALAGAATRAPVANAGAHEAPGEAIVGAA